MKLAILVLIQAFCLVIGGVCAWRGDRIEAAIYLAATMILGGLVMIQ